MLPIKCLHIHAVDKSIDSPYTLAISPKGFLWRLHKCSGHDLGNASILWKTHRVVTKNEGTGVVFVLCGRVWHRRMTCMGRAHAPINDERTGNNRNANDTTADPQAAAAQSKALQIHAFAGVSSKTRCVHARIHHHAEKAKLSHAESCKSALNKWV